MYARAHAMLQISTTRPPQQHNTLYICSLHVWSITLTRGIRPPFDHQPSAVAITETAQSPLPPIHDLYVLMSGNTLVKRWTRLLHNIWHHSFPIVETTFFQRWKVPYLTFDSTLIQRLTTPLSNVWQHSHLTLDNTFIQRWTITLSAVWKCLKIIFVYFA